MTTTEQSLASARRSAAAGHIDPTEASRVAPDQRPRWLTRLVYLALVADLEKAILAKGFPDVDTEAVAAEVTGWWWPTDQGLALEPDRDRADNPIGYGSGAGIRSPNILLYLPNRQPDSGWELLDGRPDGGATSVVMVEMVEDQCIDCAHNHGRHFSPGTPPYTEGEGPMCPILAAGCAEGAQAPIVWIHKPGPDWSGPHCTEWTKTCQPCADAYVAHEAVERERIWPTETDDRWQPKPVELTGLEVSMFDNQGDQ